MNKPQDFDNVQAYAPGTALPPGGYICKIMKVEETTAKTSGALMLKISLEIAEGEHKNYYANAYRNDTRADKKWGCVVNQLVYDSNGGNTTNRGFKAFTTCVENSNKGFNIQWGDNFGPCFKNKLIGGVFRREQYLGTDGKPHFSTKCAWFRSVEEIRKGVEVPEDKLLSGAPAASPMQASNPTQQAPYPNLADFEEIVTDGELPF